VSLVMEANSSSRPMLPVAVGGLAGHIFPAAAGQFVGGCVGFVRRNEAEHRSVGGCVGHSYQFEHLRFVGGCAGSIHIGEFSGQPVSRPRSRAHREARVASAEQSLQGAAA
jgi:hypothetical protein